MELNFSKDQLNRLYQYAVALCGNRDDAFDLTHAALERMITINQVNNPMGYARTCIRNMYIDKIRKDTRYIHEDIDGLNESDVIDISESGFEDIQITKYSFQQCWSIMNIEERELLFLFFIEGYTAQEIADETDSSRGVILSRVHRIKKKVRNEMSDTQHDDNAGGLES